MCTETQHEQLKVHSQTHKLEYTKQTLWTKDTQKVWITESLKLKHMSIRHISMGMKCSTQDRSVDILNNET